MQTADDVHGRAADFKLGRLSPHQQREFMRHVRTCDECSETLDILLQAEAAMPAAGERITANTLWGRHGAARRTTNFSRSAVPARNVLVIAAAAIFAGLGFSHVFQSPAKTTYVHGLTATGSARVALKLQGSTAELLTVGLPRPAAGDRYELYVLKSGSRGPAPAHVYLRVNRFGEGGVELPSGIGGDSAVAVYAVPSNTSRASDSAAAAGAKIAGAPVATVNLPAGSS